MQSRIRGIEDKNAKFKWHKWWAWYPSRAYILPELVWEANKANSTNIRPPWRWVWLSYVEREYQRGYGDGGWYIKRVTEETK